MKVTEQDGAGALTQETTYTYSLLDKLTDVNQGGQLRKFKYDDLGRMLYERIPEQKALIDDGTGTMWTAKYTYTDFHAVATRQDARGVITTYSYDQMNRLVGISYNTAGASGVAATPSVAYSYDTTTTSPTNGLLLSVSWWLPPGQQGGQGTSYLESYSYDSLKRLSSVTRTIDGVNYTTGYGYNAASQRNRLDYPSGRVVNINRDSIGRLSSLTEPIAGTYLSGMSYNNAGQVTGLTLGNGVSESYGYDSQRLLLTSQTATVGQTSLMNLTYNYQAQAGQMGAGTTAGNAGQLVSVTGSIAGQTESASYSYDLLARLNTSSQTTNGVSAQRRFVYDRWGNRTGVWDAVTGGNEIQSITIKQSGGAPTNRIQTLTNNGVTVNYDHDSNCNVTSDGQHTYQYDGENRLVTVDGGAAQYSYDHLTAVSRRWLGPRLRIVFGKGPR